MKTIKRNHVIVLTIAVMALIMASLTACSQKPETQEASNAATESTAETNVDETVKSTEEMEISSEAAPEQTADSASEPIPEPVVYEGIDMESDLPGEEWIQTFKGVVDEPVAVIFNDNTGRKEIIQEEGTIYVNPDEDRFALYLPDPSVQSDYNNFHLSLVERRGNYEIATPRVEGMRSEDSWEDAEITVTGGEGDWNWVRNFTIIVE